jgi:hypothetical protein
LGRLEAAKTLTVEYLKTHRVAEPNTRKGKEKAHQHDIISPMQHISVVELFITHILVPLQHFEEARALLSCVEAMPGIPKARIKVSLFFIKSLLKKTSRFTISVFTLR